jgi:23S rRNA pseudouridine2605 synthase
VKRKTDNFDKFFNKKSNSAIKEQFKQEKKAVKKERKQAIEKHFEEKRRIRPGNPALPPAKGASSSNPPDKRSTGAGASDQKVAVPGLMPINKFISHCGICSRRDAADLVKQGKITLNGQPVTDPGTKVSPNDLVKWNGKKISISRNFVYILLNKPKDCLTTTEDPQGRKTVLDLVRNASTERVYPVGRLDRNTSGVLLLTNDGDLSQKLAHPKHGVKKIYHVVLDRPLAKTDFDRVVTGVTLDDGLASVDALAYAEPKDKAQVGLEIHSGRNRIVRRIFEYLGYEIKGLDRVVYAGLTKKNLQRGKWRLLSEKEIRMLKYLNSSTR